MKQIKPKTIPKLLLKESGLPSPLEISLICNLCFFKHVDGWKSFSEIKQTDKERKNGFLKFTSPISTADKYLKKLRDRGLIDIEDVMVHDERNRGHKKRRYRLKDTGNVPVRLFSWFSSLDSLNLEGTNEINFMDLFQGSSYYQKIPHVSEIVLNKWCNLAKADLLKQIAYYTRRLEDLNEFYDKSVKHLYGIENGAIKKGEALSEELRNLLKEPKRINKKEE